MVLWMKLYAPWTVCEMGRGCIATKEDGRRGYPAAQRATSKLDAILASIISVQTQDGGGCLRPR
jgi:hypothetical protein